MLDSEWFKEWVLPWYGFYITFICLCYVFNRYTMNKKKKSETEKLSIVQEELSSIEKEVAAINKGKTNAEKKIQGLHE